MIIEKLMSDIKDAMKSHSSSKVTALRTLHADIKNASINTRKDIDDEMCIDVLAKAVKQKMEAYDIYIKANKPDMAKVELDDAELYKSYLPAQLDETEVKSLISEIVSNTGATSVKDMGKVMGQLSPQIKGKFDMKAAGQLVKTALGA